MNEAVEEQIGGRRGRKASTAPMEQDLFVRSRMDWSSYLSEFLQILPDPDEIWRKGSIGYPDLASLTRDSHASSCVDQRKSQPMSRMIRVQPAPGSEGPQSEKAHKVCQKMILDWGQGKPNLISNIMEAKLMGMQPFELNWIWDSEVGANVMRMPSDLLQEWFAYTPDGDLRYFKRNQAKPVPVPPFKVSMARHQPTMRNPYGRKLLSPCYWPVTFKRGGMRFFAEYAERFGMPTIHVQAPANTSQGSLTAFVNRLMGMLRKGIIATKGEYSVANLDMDSKYQTTHLYDSFMDAMDKETSKALLGQTLTTDEGGSRAQGDIHKQILETLWRGDDQFIASYLTDLFDLVTFVNFGPGVRGPVAVVGEQLGLDRLERDKVLRDFHGIEFKDEYLFRHYDLTRNDYTRVDPLKASYKDLPDSGKSPKDGGSRKSEAAKSTKEARDNHRNRGES